jgi:hypothetical protein
MWSRCWWATWLSGFFGIAGALHIVRAVSRWQLSVRGYEVPYHVSGVVGVVLLAISFGLLWIEMMRDRAKRHAQRVASTGPADVTTMPSIVQYYGDDHDRLDGLCKQYQQ